MKFLRREGFQLLERNFSGRFGEIDLIMRKEPNLLVFVEVRYRASEKFGGASASVTRSKQDKLKLTASTWLQANSRFRNHDCRFDVIAIAGLPGRELKINWIENAFL